MSFTRKIIDGARSGINSVIESIAADDTPLSHVDEELLHRELEARKAARSANPREPADNPIARLAEPSDSARAKREKLSGQRAARIHAAREKRERAAKAAQDEAFRQAKRRAYQQRTTNTRSSTSGRRKPGGFPFGKTDDKLAGHYRTLDLPYGAPFDEIKKSYRKLMRKYHPDRHVSNPKKQKAATELTMRVTQAYNELEQYLKENPNFARR